jgi:hypothetical protein
MRAPRRGLGRHDLRASSDTGVGRLAAVGILAAGIGLAGRGATAFSSPPPITLFNTGPERLVHFDPYGECVLGPTSLGWSSGQLCAPDCADDTFPQRRTAQPFSLPPAAEGADAWRITQIGVDGFTPDHSGPWPVNNETLHFEIFTRTDLGTPPGPADLVAAGSVPFPEPVDNPESEHPGEELHLMAVDVTLLPGGYWLTVWASNDDPDTPSNFAWFTNAPYGINVVDDSGDAYMWRSAAYPDPGFEFYRLDECTLLPYEGSDPDDLYNASFRILGAPATAQACLCDLDGNGHVGVGDFLVLLAVWGQAGVPADFDGGGVGVTDLLVMLGNWGPCP